MSALTSAMRDFTFHVFNDGHQAPARVFATAETWAEVEADAREHLEAPGSRVVEVFELGVLLLRIERGS